MEPLALGDTLFCAAISPPWPLGWMRSNVVLPPVVRVHLNAGTLGKSRSESEYAFRRAE